MAIYAGLTECDCATLPCMSKDLKVHFRFFFVFLGAPPFFLLTKESSALRTLKVGYPFLSILAVSFKMETQSTVQPEGAGNWFRERRRGRVSNERFCERPVERLFGCVREK